MCLGEERLKELKISQLEDVFSLTAWDCSESSQLKKNVCFIFNIFWVSAATKIAVAFTWLYDMV